MKEKVKQKNKNEVCWAGFFVRKKGREKRILKGISLRFCKIKRIIPHTFFEKNRENRNRR